MKWFILLLALSACHTSPQEIVSGLIYFKDPKTNLCFAGKFLGQAKFTSSPPEGLLTNVPCTPEVEHQIELRAHQ